MLWSGAAALVCGARTEDVQAIGFDEGPVFDESFDYLQQRGFNDLMRRSGIARDTTVVFYGEGVQFGIYAWWTFRYCGHAKSCVLDGARHRWANEGHPLVTDAPPPVKPVTYRPAERNEAMRIHRAEVRALLGDPGVAILDGRSPEEYSGERVAAYNSHNSGAVRAGRIPGAKHIYFEDLLNADKSVGQGFELDLAAYLTDSLLVTLGSSLPARLAPGARTRRDALLRHQPRDSCGDLPLRRPGRRDGRVRRG